MEHITDNLDHPPRIQAKRGLVAVAKVLLAAATSVGTVILALALSLQLGEIARPQPPSRPADSAEIVVDADVKNWETIFSDGPIDPASPDRQINVVDDMMVIGEDNWIIRFKVGKVVSGVFDPNEIRMLVHSPSQFGVEGQVRDLCSSFAVVRNDRE